MSLKRVLHKKIMKKKRKRYKEPILNLKLFHNISEARWDVFFPWVEFSLKISTKHQNHLILELQEIWIIFYFKCFCFSEEESEVEFYVKGLAQGNKWFMYLLPTLFCWEILCTYIQICIYSASSWRAGFHIIPWVETWLHIGITEKFCKTSILLPHLKPIESEPP